VLESLITGHEVDGSAFGSYRAVSVPGMQVRIGDMAEALARVSRSGSRGADQVATRAADRRIVSTWPSNFDCAKGLRLGMQADSNFDDIIRAHIADEQACRGARQLRARARR
jgi:hypothetical protein